MNTKDLKQLTEQYTVDQITSCIQQQLSRGENSCNVIDGTNDVITMLSKAEVVRDLMDQGMSFSDALRELGKKIRAVYGNEE